MANWEKKERKNTTGLEWNRGAVGLPSLKFELWTVVERPQETEKTNSGVTQQIQANLIVINPGIGLFRGIFTVLERNDYGGFGIKVSGPLKRANVDH